MDPEKHIEFRRRSGPGHDLGVSAELASLPIWSDHLKRKGLFQRGVAQSGAWMGIRIGKSMKLPQAEGAG